MNAAEFLALVESRASALDWRVCGSYDEVKTIGWDAVTVDVITRGGMPVACVRRDEDAHIIAAAPAMAAAIIKLLRILDDPGAFDEHQERAAVEVLRASLPESLRP